MTTGRFGSSSEFRILNSAFYRLAGAVHRTETVIAQILAVIMTIAITAEVVSRYVFRQPLGWTTEVSEWLLLAITFLGASMVLRNEGHVRVDLLLRIAPVRVRRVMDVASAVLGLTICAVATFYTAKTAYGEYAQNVLTINVLKFPRFWLLSFFPLGFLFLSVEWALKLIVRTEAMLRGRDPHVPVGDGNGVDI